MKLPPKIRVVEKFTEYRIKEKGSLFIGQIYFVETEEQVNEKLKSIRKKYFDAAHHCFAYKLVNGKFKFSDDGEPSGSAGKRIFNAIEHSDLTNQLIVVIRYFGGTKLGTGLLGKTYYETAKAVTDKSMISEKYLHQRITIHTSQKFINTIHHLFNQVSAKIINEDYSEKLVFNAYVITEKTDFIIQKLSGIHQNELKTELFDQFQYL